MQSLLNRKIADDIKARAHRLNTPYITATLKILDLDSHLNMLFAKNREKVAAIIGASLTPEETDRVVDEYNLTYMALKQLPKYFRLSLGLAEPVSDNSFDAPLPVSLFGTAAEAKIAAAEPASPMEAPVILRSPGNGPARWIKIFQDISNGDNSVFGNLDVDIFFGILYRHLEQKSLRLKASASPLPPPIRTASGTIPRASAELMEAPPVPLSLRTTTKR